MRKGLEIFLTFTPAVLVLALLLLGITAFVSTEPRRSPLEYVCHHPCDEIRDTDVVHRGTRVSVSVLCEDGRAFATLKTQTLKRDVIVRFERGNVEGLRCEREDEGGRSLK